MYAGKLSIVMPVYNEAGAIAQNLAATSRIAAALAEAYEIIAVNDGSADDTWAQIKQAAQLDPHIIPLFSPANEGKGAALRHGTQIATGDLIAFCDADLDLCPSQLSGFIRLMKEKNADVVIGSKMHKDSKVNYPFLRKVYSWMYYCCLLILFRLNTKDTQTGLKLFKAEVIKPTMRQILVKRFAFDIEVLSIVNRRGYQIVSAPIEVVFRRVRFGRIKWADIRNMVLDTLAVFYRLYILRYYDRQAEEVKEADA